MHDLQTLAKRYRIDIVAGTIVEKSAKDAEHLFNTYKHIFFWIPFVKCCLNLSSARYIDKNGNILGEYRKKHLW